MKKDKMQICLANLHFFYAIELRTKALTFEKTKIYLVFCSLIRTFAAE